LGLSCLAMRGMLTYLYGKRPEERELEWLGIVEAQ